MPSLVFHVEADYKEVLRLRQEIDTLEKKLDGFDTSTPTNEINKTKAALANAAQKFNTLTTAAAEAGAEMENTFRAKIKSAANGINDLSSEIFKQKAVIHEIEGVLADLNAAYDKASKKGKLFGGADKLLPQISEAKDRLGEAKGELFNLTQQRAEQQMSLKSLSDEYKEFRQAANETGKSVGTLKSNLGELTTEAEKQKNVIGDMAMKVGKTAAGFFAIDKLKDLAGQMINVRSQFQTADTAIQTLLGSKSKADQLMSQVREYAKISPLEFSDVTAATQMMLGFNIEAEKVPRFLSAIGDISMGEAQKFNSLTLAFSQMSATGKLMGQDLNQMINAGFNPLQQIADTTEKSIADLKKEMSDGKISAEMVQQAFVNATSEGGKFYGMSENASKTITGQMSMLQDSIDMAFNEMGEKSEGIIMDGIQLATWLVDNYEKVGKVILSVAAAYGVYRASIIACDLIEKSRAATAARENSQVEKINARTAAINVEIAKRKELLQVMNDEISAEDSKVIQDETSPDKKKSKVDVANDDYEAQKKTLDELNAQIADKANLAQQAADAAAKELFDAQEDLDLKRQQKLLAEEENDKAQEALDIALEHKEAADERVQTAKEYLETLKESSEYDGSGQGSDDDEQNAVLELQTALEEQATAAEELHSAAEAADTTQANLNTAATAENNAATRVATATENVNTTSKKAHTAATVTNTAGIKTNTTAENLSTTAKIKSTIATKAHAAGTWVATKAQAALTAATNMVKNAFQALKVAIASNPLGFIATALTTVIGLFWSMSDSEDEATEATERFGEEAAKTLGNVDVLYAVINSAAKDSKVYSDAMSELTKICEDYGIVLDSEKDKLDQVNGARDTLIGLIQKEGVERKYANDIANLQESYGKERDEIISDIADEIGNDNDTTNKAVAQAIVSRFEAQKEYFDELQGEFNSADERLNDYIKNNGYDNSERYKELAQAKTDASIAIDEARKATIEAVTSQFQERGIETNSAKEIYDAIARRNDQAIGSLVKLNETFDSSTEAIKATYEVNKDLAESQIQASKTAEGQTQAVDYTTKSFEELFTAAYGAGEAVEEVGKKEAAPEVDKSEIEDAGDAASKTAEEIDKVDEKDAKPKVDATEIENASTIADTLWGMLAKIAGQEWTVKIKSKIDDASGVLSGILGKLGSGFRAAWNKMKSRSKGGNGGNTGTGGDKHAAAELERRVQDALKTRAGTAKMLQEVNAQLQNVERGSAKEKQLLAIQKRLQDADKKPSKNSSGGKSTTDQRAETEKKQAEINRKWEEDEAKRRQDYANDATQAEIDAMEEGSKKKLAQLELDHKKELAEIDRQAEERKKEIINNAKANYEADYRNKGKDFYKSKEYEQAKADADSNEEDKAHFDTQREAAERKYNKDVAAVYKEEAEAMRSYLKDYGSFQQQRLAIAEEYAEKIAKAENEGDRLRLTRERDKALQDVEVKALTADIDWYQVFDDVGSIMKSQLEPMLARLKEYVGTADFQALGADQQQKIVEAMDNLRNSIGSNADVSWHDLAAAVTEFQSAQRDLNQAKQQETTAIKAYQNALKNSDGSKESTDALAGLKEAADKASTAVIKSSDRVRGSGNKLAQTAKDVSQPIDEIYTFLQSSGLSQLSEVYGAFLKLKGGIDGLKAINDATKGVKGLSDATNDAAKDMGDVAEKAGDALSEGLSKAGFIGQIVAAVLKILDVLKDGIGTLISSLIDSIFSAVEGILDNILSGKMFEQIGTSLYEGIGGILNNVIGHLGSALSFGSLSSKGPADWFTNSNAAKVAKTIENLQKSNDDLQKAIDANTEALDKSTGGIKSIEAANKAIEAQQKTNENYLEMAHQQSRYHNSHHSFGYYWDGLTAEQLSWAQQNLSAGSSFTGSIGDFWNLSPEDMKTLLSDVSIRERIRTTGKGGYGERVLEKLDDYADQAGKVDELVDTLNEKLTQTSFDDLRSNFLDTLMDMEADAEDFADDLTKTLTQAMLNAWMSDYMNDKIQAFYDDYAKAVKDGLDANEIAEFQKRYQTLVDEGLTKRDEIVKITGYTGDSDTKQDTSYGSASSITQDQASEGIGRITALQVQGEVRNASLTSILSNIQSLVAAQTAQTTIADGIRDLMANSYIELQGIRENTEVVIKPIKAMAARLDSWNEKIKSL